VLTHVYTEACPKHGIKLRCHMKGKERKGKERKGMERKGKERKGKERKRKVIIQRDDRNI
jgi:hypothetical protein